MAQKTKKKEQRKQAVRKNNDFFHELNKDSEDVLDFGDLETLGFDDLSRVFEEEE